MNPRYLTQIESRIWAAVFAEAYANAYPPIRCAEMAHAAVKDFRALYPETE